MIGIVVNTGAGAVRGTDQGGVVSFKGIPFAAAPEGALRFRAPVPRAAWDGVRDCADFGSASPQLAPVPGVPSVWRPESGLDCLTLNVWSPDLAAAGLPVMVWIHGGVWKLGSSSMPQYDAATLAASGVVVVTVNYRVGFEGFGHLPGVPDNRGLRDQIAALEWVRDNIVAFGGDGGNVTVFGQSAGAASAAYLAGSPAAEGLFRRVIAQSVPAGHLSVDEAAEVTATLAAAAGVRPDRDGFAAVAPEAILAVQDVPLEGRDDSFTAFGPVVDGELVTGPPRPRPDVDLICGFTHDEYLGMGPVPEGADLDVLAGRLGLAGASGYPGGAEGFVAMVSDALVRMPTMWMAEAHVRAGGRTWMYDLAWRGAPLGAAHGADVAFTFGDGTSRFAARFLGSPPPPGFAPLSERIRRAWTAFAATGDPGWPRFDLDHRRTRIWDDTPSVADDPLAASRLAWEER